LDLARQTDDTDGTLELEAAYWAADADRTQAAYLPTDQATWVQRAVPLTWFGPAEDGRTFLAAEQQIWADEGQPHRYNDVLHDPTIHTPIVLSRVGEAVCIYDGHHRIAAAIVRGMTHIDAIVGTPKAAPSARMRRAARP